MNYTVLANIYKRLCEIRTELSALNSIHTDEKKLNKIKLLMFDNLLAIIEGEDLYETK